MIEALRVTMPNASGWPGTTSHSLGGTGDHGDRILRIAAEACGIGEARDDVHELEHRSGPAMQQQQGFRIGSLSRNMQVVQINIV